MQSIWLEEIRVKSDFQTKIRRKHLPRNNFFYSIERWERRRGGKREMGETMRDNTY